MQLDFSIIVPTYNRPGELACCLESLAAIDFPKDRFEVIVIDDGGSLSVDPVVSRWVDSLRITALHETNGGPARARNSGARMAAGKFLAFTDDDCEPSPDWLSAFFGILRDEPGAMVGGRTVNALVDNPYATASQLIVDLVYDHYNPEPRQARFFATNNMAVSAARFHALNGFDSDFRTSEDRDFCDRWTGARYPMMFVPDAVVYHSHKLSFGSYWMQHVNYGRGARRFYLSHKKRDSESSTIKGNFYLRLPQRIPRAIRGKPRPWYLAFLMLVWQVASFVGFVLEILFPVKPASFVSGSEQ
jgi:glycosyltransferase involved in cell wall biosynthesis